MDNKLKVIKSKIDNRKTIYSHKFLYENENGIQLKVEASYNVYVANLMVSLGDIKDEVKQTERYIEISKELFKIYDGNEIVNGYVTANTWVDLFVVYMENFADEITRAMEQPKVTDATPSFAKPRVY